MARDPEVRVLESASEEGVPVSREASLEQFSRLFAEYERPVYNLCYRMIGNREDAEDIKQEAFLKAYHSLPGFRGDCKLSTWLFRIAINLCMDHRRKGRKWLLTTLDGPGKDSLSSPTTHRGSDPEKAFAVKELREKVDEVLQELSPDYRALIVLRDLEGLPYEEVARIMGCSLASVKVRLHRARQAFKEKIGPYFD